MILTFIIIITCHIEQKYHVEQSRYLASEGKDWNFWVVKVSSYRIFWLRELDKRKRLKEILYGMKYFSNCRGSKKDKFNF